HHVVKAHHRWDTENVEVPVKERGVYLVEAVHEEYRAYTILMVTNLVMVTKTGAGRIVNFVVDRATGQPVGGAQISIVPREGHRSSVTTSADGLAEIPVTGAHPGEMSLVAKHEADIAVNPLADYAFRSEAERSLGYVYTDRPVYRPSHTVHFKAVLRLRNPEGYAIPAGKAVQVEIQDPEQKPIYQKPLTVNANGSIHDEIRLPPTAGLGSYSIQLHTGDQSYNETSFEVEEYKKPEYEVRVTPSVTRVLQGQPIQAVIDARYYFGEPVSGAKVTYTVH